MEHIEIQGRLLLWKNAFDNAYVVLLTAFRSDSGRKQSAQDQDAIQYVKSYEEFIRNNPDCDIHQFNSQHPRQFPTIEECYVIYNVCIEHAINCFCKVFNLGHGLPGSVSKNDQKFRDEHLPKIKTIAFSTESEQRWFDELSRRAKEIRDTMISHDDANNDPIYTDKHSTISGTQKLWKLIPLNQFHSMLNQLSKAIELYMKSLTPTEQINN
jgi:hypothetical protein